MDPWTVFAIIFAVIWANLSLAKIAIALDQIERNSKRSADAIDLMARIANLKQSA